MARKFSVSALSPSANRAAFDCGVEPLNRYFHAQVTQDIKRRITACFVVMDDSGVIAGYYTLASAGILLADLPTDLSKRLPRYPSVPAVRMGRLAVDQSFKGQGLGSALLANALRRSATAQIAAYAMVVDAKDENAAGFYRHHGFTTLTNDPLVLFIPLATLKLRENP